MRLAYADFCFTETPNAKVGAQAKGKSVRGVLVINECCRQQLNRVFSGPSQKAPVRGKKAKEVEKAKPEEKKEDAKPEAESEEKTPAENGETKADEVSPFLIQLE